MSYIITTAIYVNHCKAFHKIILNYSLHTQADVQKSTRNQTEESLDTVASQGTYSKVNQPTHIFDSKADIVASVKSETVSGGPTNTTKDKKETQSAETHPSPTGDCHHGHSILVEANRNDVMKPTQANDVKSNESQLEQEKDTKPKMKDRDSDVSL